MSAIGRFSVTLAIACARTLSDGWAFMWLWHWFIAPLGVASLGFWHACGIDLMVGAFLAMSARRQPDSDENWAENMGFAAGKLCVAPIVVGVAYLIHGAM